MMAFLMFVLNLFIFSENLLYYIFVIFKKVEFVKNRKYQNLIKLSLYFIICLTEEIVNLK